MTLKSGQQIMVQQLQKLQQNSSSPTLSIPIASFSAQGEVSPMQILTPQTPEHSNFTGNAVKKRHEKKETGKTCR